MGTCHQAVVALGFIIPEEKLVALLKVLQGPKDNGLEVIQAEESNSDDKEPDEESDKESGDESQTSKKAKLSDTDSTTTRSHTNSLTKVRKNATLSEKEVNELRELVEWTLGDLYKHFKLTLCKVDGERGMVVSFANDFSVETWGRDDVETVASDCLVFDKDEIEKGVPKEKIEELEKKFYFKELDIEFEKDWVQWIEVG